MAKRVAQLGSAIRLGRLGFGLAALSLPITPALAVGPQTLCSSGSQAATGTIPDTNEMDRVTRAAENLLEAGDPLTAQSAEALELLELESAASTETDPRALASYCLVAGQIVREAGSGSELRARDYFLTALRNARSAGAHPIIADAAYRMAQVSNNIAVTPDSRSARRAMGLETDSAAAEDPVERSDDHCEYLATVDLQREDKWSAAAAALACATTAAELAGDARLETLAHLQEARLYLREAELRPFSRDILLEETIAASTRGIQSASSIQRQPLRFGLVARLIETRIEAGDIDYRSLSRALSGLRAIASSDPEQQAVLFGLEGRVRLAGGDNGAAAAALRRAIFNEMARLRPLRLADWYLLLSQAVPEERARYVMQAYRALEDIRPLLPARDEITEESLFQLRMRPVFRAAVDVQLAGTTVDDAGLRIGAAQEIIEAFRQAEMVDAFGADCVPPREAIRPADLRPGEILLYPIILPDRLELIYATAADNGGQAVYRRVSQTDNADADRIRNLVNEASFSLGYGDDDEWAAYSRELYSLLIDPIADLLSPQSTLIIVPDGALRRLPFAALVDERGQMLAQRTRMTIAPALSFAQPGSEGRGTPNVVAASVSDRVTLLAGNFPALPGTRGEARMAAGLGDEDRSAGVILDNFSRADLRDSFSNEAVDILHLATHASFNGGSNRSFIVANGEAILLSELRSLVEANKLRGDQLSLIVLSACETALGDDQASMGLAGAAIQAGAESALASLWQVDDAGTVELMRQFYRNYSQGQARAEALRNAQLAMIARGDRMSDPRIWAAFTLIGGWR